MSLCAAPPTQLATLPLMRPPSTGRGQPPRRRALRYLQGAPEAVVQAPVCCTPEPLAAVVEPE